MLEGQELLRALWWLTQTLLVQDAAYIFRCHPDYLLTLFSILLVSGNCHSLCCSLHDDSLHLLGWFFGLMLLCLILAVPVSERETFREELVVGGSDSKLNLEMSCRKVSGS